MELSANGAWLLSLIAPCPALMDSLVPMFLRGHEGKLVIQGLDDLMTRNTTAGELITSLMNETFLREIMRFPQ